jgi:hypothetical protein
MTLSRQDKEFIQLIISGVNAKSEYFHDLTAKTLKELCEKVDKTNGRVSKLEEKDNEQTLFCGKIQAIKEEKDKQRGKTQRTINLVFAGLMVFLTLFAILERRAVARYEGLLDRTRYFPRVDSTTHLYFRGATVEKLDSIYWMDKN